MSMSSLMLVAIVGVSMLWLAFVFLFVGHKLPSHPSSLMTPSTNTQLMVQPKRPRPTTFLIGVFMTADEKNQHRRDLMRNTMFGLNDTRVCPLYKHIDQVTSGSNRSKCQVLYAFVIGANPNGKKENVANNLTSITIDPRNNNNNSTTSNTTTMLWIDEPDMVRLNIQENMNDGKTPTWFKYGVLASDAYGIDYISKCDYDTLISIPRLLDFMDTYLPSLEDPKYHPTYGGMMFDSKYCGYPKNRHCEKLDGRIYMSGQFYFTSVDIARHVTSPKFPRKRSHFEDFDWGMWVSKFGKPISIMELNSGMFWFHPLKQESDWKNKWNKGQKNSSIYANWLSWKTDYND